jgi:Tfp pilus assembly protein PilV
MSEFIIAVIIISVILVVISKVQKKSDKVESQIPTQQAAAQEIKPIVKPLSTNESIAKTDPIIKAEEIVVVVSSPTAIVSKKIVPSNVQIPEDSVLRRHFLNQLHQMLESCKENRPTDSALVRHYDESIRMVLESFSNNLDEIQCLFSYYENHHKVLTATKVKSTATAPIILDINKVESILPEDSALRRHTIQLSNQ